MKEFKESKNKPQLKTGLGKPPAQPLGQQDEQDRAHTASTTHRAIFVVKLLTVLPQLCTDVL